MKRLYIVLSLILLILALAVPAVARADDAAPTPAEQTQPADVTPDGWTWDESSAPAAVDGWTWDEA